MKRLKSVIKLEKRIDDLMEKRTTELERRSNLLEDLKNKNAELLKQKDQAMLDGNLELFQTINKDLEQNQADIEMMEQSIKALDERELISVEEYIKANEEVEREYYSYIEPLKKEIRQAYNKLKPLFDEEDSVHEDMNAVMKKWQKQALRSKDNPKHNADGGVSIFSRVDNENTDFLIFYSLHDFIQNDSTDKIVNGE